MFTSVTGRDLIKKYEGLRTTAYKCPAGVLTIGYGHTKGVTKDMHITKVEAEALLIKDLAVAENAVNIYVDRYKLNQNEYDSLVSFTFNCGVGNLNKLCNKGLRKKSEIANKMLSYNKANGKVLSGLTARRADERRLFLTPITDVTAMGVDYSPVFDAAYYAEKYSDIRAAYGSDAKAMFEHFLVFGMNEHRQASPEFNVDTYAKLSPDVVEWAKVDRKVSWPKIYQHYCIFGRKEGRVAI